MRSVKRPALLQCTGLGILRAILLLQETASHIRGLKLWVTNEYRHSGIRDDGTRIFERLLGMARNVVFD